MARAGRRAELDMSFSLAGRDREICIAKKPVGLTFARCKPFTAKVNASPAPFAERESKLCGAMAGTERALPYFTATPAACYRSAE
jgi:hypothetical protein